MEKDEILDSSILIEGKSGLTTALNIIEHPPAGKTCHVLYPQRQDFDLAIELSLKLRKAGKPVGAIDIIISSICINNGLKLVTKDSDFNAIKAVEPSFILSLRR